jgi:tRNA G46 methylase TrmB
MYPNQRVSTEALYAAAALNLLATPVPAFARVMEIGCGSATSLIMHAWANPESIAIGVDIDGQAILKGKQLVAGLGCQNVELFEAGLGFACGRSR